MGSGVAESSCTLLLVVLSAGQDRIFAVSRRLVPVGVQRASCGFARVRAWRSSILNPTIKILADCQINKEKVELEKLLKLNKI